MFRRFGLIVLTLSFLPLTSSAAAVFVINLGVGSRGAEVVRLQQFLSTNTPVFPAAAASGYFGVLTRAAVRAFQRSRGITPVSGFVGPKTRAVINQLLAQTLIPLTGSTTVATSSANAAPPQFIQGPTVSLGPATTSSPFGLAAPVQVSLSWMTNKPTAPASFTCSPPLAQYGFGLQATYWAGFAQTSSCTLVVQDQIGNTATATLSFAMPGWLGFSVSGGTQALAENTKLGEFSLTNASTSLVELDAFTILVQENLQAPSVKGRSFSLVLRDGTTTNATVIARANVPVDALYPPAGVFNTRQVVLNPALSMGSGAAKTLSLWVEGLAGPYYGGSIRFSLISIATNPAIQLLSGGNTVFIMTQPN